MLRATRIKHEIPEVKSTEERPRLSVHQWIECGFLWSTIPMNSTSIYPGIYAVVYIVVACDPNPKPMISDQRNHHYWLALFRSSPTKCASTIVSYHTAAVTSNKFVSSPGLVTPPRPRTTYTHDEHDIHTRWVRVHLLSSYGRIIHRICIPLFRNWLITTPPPQ